MTNMIAIFDSRELCNNSVDCGTSVENQKKNETDKDFVIRMEDLRRKYEYNEGHIKGVAVTFYYGIPITIIDGNAIIK